MQPGKCYWDEDVLVYGTIRFSIHEFRMKLAHHIAEAKAKFALLLYSDQDAGIPCIEWNKFQDTLFQWKAGYSFLTESANQWIASQRNYLIDKVQNNPVLRNRWYNHATDSIDQNTLDMYKEEIDKLRELLLGLIHFTAGQPACGTEITNLRFENDSTA
jgi:hypothetical protein